MTSINLVDKLKVILLILVTDELVCLWVWQWLKHCLSTTRHQLMTHHATEPANSGYDWWLQCNSLSLAVFSVSLLVYRGYDSVFLFHYWDIVDMIDGFSVIVYCIFQCRIDVSRAVLTWLKLFVKFIRISLWITSHLTKCTYVNSLRMATDRCFFCVFCIKMFKFG